MYGQTQNIKGYLLATPNNTCIQFLGSHRNFHHSKIDKYIKTLRLITIWIVKKIIHWHLTLTLSTLQSGKVRSQRQHIHMSAKNFNNLLEKGILQHPLASNLSINLLFLSQSNATPAILHGRTIHFTRQALTLSLPDRSPRLRSLSKYLFRSPFLPFFPSAFFLIHVTKDRHEFFITKEQRLIWL